MLQRLREAAPRIGLVGIGPCGRMSGCRTLRRRLGPSVRRPVLGREGPLGAVAVLSKSTCCPASFFSRSSSPAATAPAASWWSSFYSLGPATGLLAMAVATIIWSAVAASSFELARLTRSYDYRTFFKHLLGRGWFLYEIISLPAGVSRAGRRSPPRPAPFFGRRSARRRYSVSSG